MNHRLITLPMLSQQHVYAGNTTLMGAILLGRILLSDANSSQRRKEYSYHEKAASGSNQSRRVPSSLRAWRKLHQADDQHYCSQ